MSQLQENAEPLHIMVVEDDPSLAEWMFDYLTNHGFMVTVANRGDEAVTLIHADDPDLVVLDVMLPGKDGFEVCAEVRKFYGKPILMLTARGEESDEVRGLETGADDYLGKPVRPKVLLARINLLLKRGGSNLSSQIIEIGALRIDTESRTVELRTPIKSDQTGGRPNQQATELVNLSSQEFDLVCLLARNAGTTMSRDELVSQMRGINYDGFDRSIDISISRLRKKLHDIPAAPRRIKTIRGKGYLLATDAW